MPIDKDSVRSLGLEYNNIMFHSAVLNSDMRENN